MSSSYRLIVLAALFVTCLITANTIAVKIIGVGPFEVPAAILVFPLSYVFGDVLTEVYGFKVTRRVIWMGFACNLVFVFFAWIGQLLPAAGFWEGQAAYETILGYTPRLLAASFAGYLVGEFVNSFILAKMKIMTRGRWLWSRTIGSTIIGQGLDTSIFIVIAFIGTPAFGLSLVLTHWLAKVGIETVCTPLTYGAVNWLKRVENIDTYDTGTRFNPFIITR